MSEYLIARISHSPAPGQYALIGNLAAEKSVWKSLGAEKCPEESRRRKMSGRASAETSTAAWEIFPGVVLRCPEWMTCVAP